MELSVREFTEKDVDVIVDYFIESDKEYLKGMGVELEKLPKRDEWVRKIHAELPKPNEERSLFYVIWLIDGEPVGHSNINEIVYGEVATMHLHVWDLHKRQNGLGIEFLKRTIPLYFEKFKLKKLVCQPFAKNIPPNRTLKKFGFQYLGNLKVIPGPINFFQEVSRYELSLEKIEEMKTGF